jgi:cell division protein FtsB
MPMLLLFLLLFRLVFYHQRITWHVSHAEMQELMQTVRGCRRTLSAFLFFFFFPPWFGVTIRSQLREMEQSVAAARRILESSWMLARVGELVQASLTLLEV